MAVWYVNYLLISLLPIKKKNGNLPEKPLGLHSYCFLWEFPSCFSAFELITL